MKLVELGLVTVQTHVFYVQVARIKIRRATLRVPLVLRVHLAYTPQNQVHQEMYVEPVQQVRFNLPGAVLRVLYVHLVNTKSILDKVRATIVWLGFQVRPVHLLINTKHVRPVHWDGTTEFLWPQHAPSAT